MDMTKMRHTVLALRVSPQIRNATRERIVVTRPRRYVRRRHVQRLDPLLLRLGDYPAVMDVETVAQSHTAIESSQDSIRRPQLSSVILNV